MGCGGSKEYEPYSSVTIGTPATRFTTEQCMLGKATPGLTSPFHSTKYEVSASLDTKEFTLVDMDRCNTVFIGKPISLMRNESAAYDPTGKRITVSKGKTLQKMPSTTQMRNLRFTPSFDGQTRSEDFACDDRKQGSELYSFSKVEATLGIGRKELGAKGSYELYTSDSGDRTEVVLTGRRVAKPGKAKFLFFDANGTCIAKAKQLDLLGKKVEFDIASGIDPAAVVSLQGALAGGHAGGLGDSERPEASRRRREASPEPQERETTRTRRGTPQPQLPPSQPLPSCV